MSMEKLVQVISQAAPLLGGVLGGPAGAAIGSIIASKFGGDINDPSDLLSKITADPQSTIKLMEIQSNHAIELEKIKMQMAQNELKSESMQRFIEYRDRDSARKREELLAEYGKHDNTASILSYVLTFGVFCALGYLFYMPAQESNKELIVALISSLSTVWVHAMGYYYGSSNAAKKIDKELNKN